MSDIYTIYKATNVCTGQSYIGFDSNWPNRKHTHYNSYRKKRTKFYLAILKYGWESFSWEVLYQSNDKDHCFKNMEHYFIQKYNTIDEGYNMTEGGAGVIGVTKDTVWINNGIDHKRVKHNEIPDGWSLGRLKIVRKIRMSQESKNLIGQKNKGRLTEGNNPSARKIKYKGKIYSCIRSAAIEHNTSVYFVKKDGCFI